MENITRMLHDFAKEDYVAFQDRFNQEVKTRIASRKDEIRQSVADVYFNEKKNDNQHTVKANIENEKALYDAAVKTKSAKEFERKMLSMKNRFPDAKTIDFNKVDWKEIFDDMVEDGDIEI